MCRGWANAHEQRIRKVGSLLDDLLGIGAFGVYSVIPSESSMKPKSFRTSLGDDFSVVIVGVGVGVVVVVVSNVVCNLGVIVRGQTEALDNDLLSITRSSRVAL